MNILVVGATGSIGRLVVDEAIRQGHSVRALVRTVPKGGLFPVSTQIVVGDLTTPDTLAAAVRNVDGIVFTHGSSSSKASSEAVDYGGVRNILRALGNKRPRLSLMTAIGVTNRTGSYNKSTEAHDWKRRGERLVRASGLSYTIVRPGWFDYNADDEHHLVLLQGDTRQSGTPSDGCISRRQLAHVLVGSLTSDAARNLTFELIATKGPTQDDLESLFASLTPDPQGTVDGVKDGNNMPLDAEPQRVRDELHAVLARSMHESVGTA